MMFVRMEAGHTAVIISYQNSNVEQHFFVTFFFLLVCGRFYTPSRIIIPRSLLGISDQTFYIGIQNVQSLEDGWRGFFCFTFVLLVWMFLVPYTFQCRSHTFAMKRAHALRTHMQEV